jgi:hypothetical protein
MHTSTPAIDAAMLLARAFQSEVESLFVEDRQLFDLSEFPFARAISVEEGWRELPRDKLEHAFRYVGAALQRQVADAAKRAQIPCRSRVVRDDPLHAVASACAENGPWNVITIAEPFAAGDEQRLHRIFADVSDTTGVIVAGPLARRTQGPVIAVVEQLDRLGPMLKTAERLAGVTGGTVKLMLVGDRPDELDAIEGQARLVFAEHAAPPLETVLTAGADPVPVAEAVRRHNAGFLLAQFGGMVVSEKVSLRPLAGTLDCPLFLVR